MADPIQVEVTRGDVVEALHTVHAVAVRDGRIVAEAGDPRLLTFLRSSAKPLQALPLARARPDIDDRELAIACASHRALPEQLDAVRALLADAPATEAELETGADPSPIQHNCSGKHAGFLAVCRARGLETHDYRLGTHPLQEEIRRRGRRRRRRRASTRCRSRSTAAACRRSRCPSTAALTRSPSCLGSRVASRVVAAMRAHPEMLRGPVAADVMFIAMASRTGPRRAAPRVSSAPCSDDGLGIAVKVEDGAFRAIRPAVATFLLELGLDPGELGIVTVENSRGEPVGTVRTRLKSRVPKR